MSVAALEFVSLLEEFRRPAHLACPGESGAPRSIRDGERLNRRNSLNRVGSELGRFDSSLCFGFVRLAADGLQGPFAMRLIVESHHHATRVRVGVVRLRGWMPTAPS